MNINRHNYEEYFILYMDNELSSDNRRMVEAFVQQHPDLKDELELLQQFKLTPDTSITFSGKEELLKESPAFSGTGGEPVITINNYQEWFVLYADNELTPSQKEKVEKFIANNPASNVELALLQKTKLQPETIAFPDKKILYRRGEKTRRIIPAWLRVAAVLLLAVGLATFVLVRNKTKEPGEIVSSPKDGKTITPVVDDKVKIETKDVAVSPGDNKLPEEKVVIIPVDKKQAPAAPAYQTALIKQENNNNNTIAENKKDVKDKQQPEINQQPVIATTNNKPDNNLPKPDNNPYIIKKDETKNAVAKEDPPKQNNDTNNSLTNEVVTPDNPQPSDYILASNDGKRNKSRGLFRKIARTFEKRTNIDPTNDDGRLLVAGFAFKTK
jgi:hypothetical protein